MDKHYSDNRKINPVEKNGYEYLLTDEFHHQIEIGPTNLAVNEWMKVGLELPNLQKMREYRWERLVKHIVERDYGGVLLFDPLNIRYATDSTNMQIWNMHNPFRAVLICSDGFMVIWDYKNSPFLSTFNPLVKEQRFGADLFYFARGDKANIAADKFSNEIRILLKEHSGGNKKLAVDKILVNGLKALETQGLEIFEGEELTEKARSIKGEDEIKAMRCASVACENSVYLMEDFAREKVPSGNISEDEIWSVLHAENIKRGGEWIETRLLASGPRTNPWFQECGPRITRNNEIIAFDTDLVGCYGICVDISRTWWIGDKNPRPDMIYAMQHAYEHIMTNMAMLKPGVSMEDLTHNSHRLDQKFQKGKYGVLMHGVGLCDEWPSINYPDGFQKGAYDYPLEEGMVMCVEVLASPEGGDFSIKLEDQVLITAKGYENLTKYPFDPRLMGKG